MENRRTLKKMRLWHYLFLVFLVVGTVLILRNQNVSYVWQTTEGKIFGTYFQVKYKSSLSLDSLILRELMVVDSSLSMFNPKSTVSLVNSNLDLSSDSLLDEVFHLSNEVSKNTNGAFDVTVAPLVNLWGFGFEKADDVQQVQVDSLLKIVGYEKVSLKEGEFMKMDPRLMLDFSAVAKGYGVDRVAKFLDSKGVSDYIVNIGGEIITKGRNSNEELWIVGIESPSDSILNSSQAFLRLSGVALATSGNYRRFYYKDGKRFAHTINPATGYPVQHSLLSATVIAPNCGLADAYATAFMVMGLDKSIDFLKKHQDLSAYFIYSSESGEMKTWCSESLNSMLIDR